MTNAQLISLDRKVANDPAFRAIVLRAIEIYRTNGSNLVMAAREASDEAGGQWNVTAVQMAAHRIIFA